MCSISSNSFDGIHDALSDVKQYYRQIEILEEFRELGFRIAIFPDKPEWQRHEKAQEPNCHEQKDVE